MAQINLGRVKGDKGDKGDAFKYSDFTSEQLAALKGKDGVTPTIKVGTVTTLGEDKNATVTASTSGTTTTFNFGIPQGKGADASIFNGTSAEYESKKSTIANGTIVNITDDIVNGELLSVDTLNRVSTVETNVNKKVNKSDILTTMEQVEANTNTGKLASATVIKEISESLGGLEFTVIDGKPQWKERGADTWSPFKSGSPIEFNYSGTRGTCCYFKVTKGQTVTLSNVSGSNDTGINFNGSTVLKYSSGSIQYIVPSDGEISIGTWNGSSSQTVTFNLIIE